MRQVYRSCISFFIVVSVFLLSATLVNISTPLKVSADAVSGTDKTPGIADLTERWLRYRAVAGCYSTQDVGKNSIDEIESGTWLKRGMTKDNVTTIGYLNSDGKVSCGDGAMVSNSLEKIGFGSNIESFCSMSTAKRDGKKNYANCVQGTGEFDMDGSTSTQFDAFTKAVREKTKQSALIPYRTDSANTKPILYYVGLQSLKTFCGGKRGSEYTSSQAGNIGNAKRKVVVNEVDLSDGKVKRYVYNLSKDEDTKINDIWAETGGASGGLVNSTINSKDLTCNELAKLTWTNDEAFGAFVVRYNAAEPDDKPAEGTLAGEDGDGASAGETSCAIDGVGWVVCPLMNFVASANEKAFGFLSSELLMIRPALVNDEATKNAWSAFRNVANVMFVIAFLFIIYSQMTGLGVSNYGIKKLLPKLVVAAVLVNTSFWLCAIAIDISNIIGNSLYSLLGTSFDSAISTSAGSGDSTWTSIMTTVLIGGVSVLLVVMILVAPIVLLPIALVMFILIARQAFVILLIVAAPLAFVAYLLPNTNDWFKKWQKAFMGVLLIYPIIALVFGVSTLASNILLEVAGEAGNASGGNDDETLLSIIALAVMAVPLFALPVLLKGSLSTMGSVGKALSGLQDKATGRAKSGVKDSRLGEAKNAFDRRRQQNKVSARLGRGRMTRYGSFLKDNGGSIGGAIGSKMQKYDVAQAGAKLDNSKYGKVLGGDRGAAGAVVANTKLNREDMEAAETLFHEKTDPREAITRAGIELGEAMANGDVTKARAMQKILLSSGSKGVEQLNKTIMANEANMKGGATGSISEALRHDLNSAGLKGKDNALASWAFTPGATLASQSTDPSVFNNLNEQELAGQTSSSLNSWKTAITNASDPADQQAAQELAARVLDQHAKGTIQLDSKKLNILQTIAGNSQTPLQVPQPNLSPPSNTPASPPTSSAQSASGPTLRGGESTTDSGLIIPRDRE